MLRLTLAQMRRSIGRLTAAAVAIVIGTAFLAATLLAGTVMTRTTYDAVTTSYADADLVVAGDQLLTDREVAAIDSVSGVDAVAPSLALGTELIGPSGAAWIEVQAPADDPRLEPVELVDGRAPTTSGEIVLPDDVAGRLGVGIDAQVRSAQSVWTEPEDGSQPVPQTHEEELTVVGLSDGSASAFLGTGGTGLVEESQLTQWYDLQDLGEPAYDLALVAVADATTVTSVQDSIAAALGEPYHVRTKDEHAAQIVASFTGSTQALTAVVLAFAGVALLVASLVIANTFQVLVAQRTRMLALLRCVGADRAQLRRSVITEALLLGVTASLGGVVLGTAVVQGALAVLNATGTDVPLPATVSISLAAVLVPLLTGTLVTVVAALAPARAATRVSPLAALQPTLAPRLGERAGKVRAGIAVVLTVGGLLGLVGGVVVAAQDQMIGLALGMLAGAVSFIGLLVGAVFWVPRLIAGLGGLVTRGGGPAARLAASNSARNPRRTAATSAALLIGVTLVAMMSTGAASARTALNEALDAEFPVDVAVRAFGSGGSDTPLPAGFRQQVTAMDGVVRTAELTGGVAEAVGAQDVPTLDVAGVEPSSGAELLREPGQLAELTDTTALVRAGTESWLGLTDGQELVLEPAGDGDGQPVTVQVVAVPDLASDGLLLSAQTMGELLPQAPVNQLWAQLDDLGAAEDVVAEIEAAAAETQVGLSTSGAAVERAFFQQVVDTLLAVVIGLLGVAVVIALVGVANTLSLSVIERRRESATLRAIGLSRRQLRGTLAVEGMLIALVGALVGAVLGTFYGWVGARTLLGELTSVGLTVPWGHLGLVLVVAVVAGLLASVLPGRSAARTSPVEALAVD